MVKSITRKRSGTCLNHDLGIIQKKDCILKQVLICLHNRNKREGQSLSPYTKSISSITTLSIEMNLKAAYVSDDYLVMLIS